MIAAANCFYEGYWRDDKPHGKGRLVLKDLTVIEGNFKDGLIKRQWTDSEGNLFDGFCNLNCQAHGKCKVKYPSGDCYDGQWCCGKKQGEGIYTSGLGPAFHCEWVDDKLFEY